MKTIMTDKKIKLAYALSGEGKGHVARTTAISSFLSKKYEIIYYCPKSVHESLLNQIPKAIIRTIPGWFFAMENGKVLYSHSVKKNTENIFQKKRVCKPIIKNFIEDNIEAVISDYEPFCTLAGKKLKLPVLSISHPAVVNTHPKPTLEWLAAKVVADQMLPRVNRYIVSSFYNGDIGPIVRTEIKQAKVTQGSHFTVYCKKDSQKKIIEMLQACKISDYHLFPSNERDFVQSLSSCKAVIAPGGHQLMTEAVYLNKPILVFPIKDHFEQNLNAKMLTQSGKGMKGHLNDAVADLKKFLLKLEKIKNHTPDPNSFNFSDSTQQCCHLIENFLQHFVIEKKSSHLKYSLNRITGKINRNRLT